MVNWKKTMLASAGGGSDAWYGKFSFPQNSTTDKIYYTSGNNRLITTGYNNGNVILAGFHYKNNNIFMVDIDAEGNLGNVAQFDKSGSGVPEGIMIEAAADNKVFCQFYKSGAMLYSWNPSTNAMTNYSYSGQYVFGWRPSSHQGMVSRPDENVVYTPHNRFASIYAIGWNKTFTSFYNTTYSSTEGMPSNYSRTPQTTGTRLPFTHCLFKTAPTNNTYALLNACIVQTNNAAQSRPCVLDHYENSAAARRGYVFRANGAWYNTGEQYYNNHLHNTVMDVTTTSTTKYAIFSQGPVGGGFIARVTYPSTLDKVAHLTKTGMSGYPDKYCAFNKTDDCYYMMMTKWNGSYLEVDCLKISSDLTTIDWALSFNMDGGSGVRYQHALSAENIQIPADSNGDHLSGFYLEYWVEGDVSGQTGGRASAGVLKVPTDGIATGTYAMDQGIYGSHNLVVTDTSSSWSISDETTNSYMESLTVASNQFPDMVDIPTATRIDYTNTYNALSTTYL
jgi:hypothetical protein